MTVKEVIEGLKQFPDDMIVISDENETMDFPITSITLEKASTFLDKTIDGRMCVKVK